MQRFETAIIIISEGKPILEVPIADIPTGATFREAYETDLEIVVCGLPKPDDEKHDCDVMGCNTGNHILYRFKK